MQAITQYLVANGYTTVDDNYYTSIALWLKWYRGKVPAFHNYTQYNGRRKVRRERKSLGLAKKIAEDWASLLLNEKVEITISDDAAHERVWEVLNANNFRVRGNQLVEVAFALGTGAFVEYTDGDDVIIDYVRAGMIYPLSWDNGEITECAFASERKKGKEKYVYLNIHRLNENGNGTYVIENLMFRRNGGLLTLVDLPEGVIPIVETGSDIPRFQIIRPNIVNNEDMDCPLGISVYANAIDQLENVDLVFDSYNNEFRLGKKRIMVPVSMARNLMEADGVATPMFDDNDVEFYVLATGESANGQKIEEINGELRSDAHEKGISTAINLCAYKCGFGENKYKFEGGAAKTATEVVSEDGDMFRNLRKHELPLSDALTALVKTIASMLGIKTEFDVAIMFDDSIIEDTAAERMRDLQDVRDGIMSKVEYRMKWYGDTEKDARKAIEEAGSGNATMPMFGDA